MPYKRRLSKISEAKEEADDDNSNCKQNENDLAPKSKSGFFPDLAIKKQTTTLKEIFKQDEFLKLAQEERAFSYYQVEQVINQIMKLILDDKKQQKNNQAVKIPRYSANNLKGTNGKKSNKQRMPHYNSSNDLNRFNSPRR